MKITPPTPTSLNVTSLNQDKAPDKKTNNEPKDVQHERSIPNTSQQPQIRKCSLAQRKKLSLQLHLKENLTINKDFVSRNNSSSALEELVKSILKNVNRVVEEPKAVISSENGEISYFQLGRLNQEETKKPIYVHSLIGKVQNNDFEKFSADFWQQLHKMNIKKVIALADPPYKPKYMPPTDNQGRQFISYNLKPNQIRTYQNGITAEILKITDLEGFEGDKSDIFAKPREVVVNLTIPGYENTEKKQQVTIDQIYCWSDSTALKPAYFERILRRINCETTQIHCEGGINRSPALVVAYNLEQLLQKKELTKENFVETLQAEIIYAREQRGVNNAINNAVLTTVLDYFLHQLKISPEDLLPENPKAAYK